MSTPAYQCLRVPSSCLIISSQTMEKWKHKRFFHRMNNSNHQGHSQSKGFHADTRTTSAEEKTINMSDTETANDTETMSDGEIVHCKYPPVADPSQTYNLPSHHKDMYKPNRPS